MQKVILLPKMTLKEQFFVSRLVVFNETFASVKDDGDYVILWHEAISGRLAVDVASTYIRCINICESGKVIFWADHSTVPVKIKTGPFIPCFAGVSTRIGALKKSRSIILKKGIGLRSCVQIVSMAALEKR